MSNEISVLDEKSVSDEKSVLVGKSVLVENIRNATHTSLAIGMQKGQWVMLKRRGVIILAELLMSWQLQGL